VLAALKRALLPGQIVVAFETAGTDWKLSVSDSGIGDGADPAQADPAQADPTQASANIVRALAGQLQAEVDVVIGPTSTTVSIAHATPRPTGHLAAARRSRGDRTPEPQRALEVPGKSDTGSGKFAA
jgi:hypothetical protein